MLRSGEDGLHDGVCSGDGSRSHVRHFLLSQDRDARPGADGRSGEDHDAERRNVWDVYGDRDGHPLLRTDSQTPFSLIYPRLLFVRNTTELWDFTKNYNRTSVHCHSLKLQSSFVNKCSELSDCEGF